jgi:hypothetical protein
VIDQPQSPRAHPSPDELADLRADSLGPDRSAEIAAHVVTCSSCTDELAAMDDVEILLSAAGREPLLMPTEVAASLDAALARASLERAAGVASLDEKRGEHPPAELAAGGRSRLSKLIPALGAAAAVFIIAGLAFDLGPNRDAEDAMTAGDGAASAQPESGRGGLGAGGNTPSGPDRDAGELRWMAPQKVTKHNVRQYASALSAAPTASILDYAFDSMPATDRLCPPTRLSETFRRTPVEFEGELAYVVVKTAAREVMVYTCESPPERLYSTSY